jgi:hypothetical protein
MKIAFACVATALLLAFSTAAFGQVPLPNPYPTMAPIAKYLMPSAGREIALARSAGPSSISAHARVLVFTKQGYVVGSRAPTAGSALSDARGRRVSMIPSSGTGTVSGQHASILRPCEAYFRFTLH